MEVGLDNLGGPYDLIVIGSGPAGLTLARQYASLTTGKTLILESGHRSNLTSTAQELRVVDAAGDLPPSRYPIHNQRAFGGTSAVWNGWCAVLEKRSFSNGEWPFAYDDLYRYYPEAADILSIPKEVHTHPEIPFPDNTDIVYKPYYFSPPTRFNVLFQDWLAQSATVDVLFNHTVTSIRVKDGIAASVFIQESSRNRTVPVEVWGNRIALAAGGIQNARLLHLSLPGDHELPVGLYFCEHPHMYNYTDLILDEQKFQQIKYKPPSGTRIVHAIALSSDFSNAHRLKSVTFQVNKPVASVRNILGRSRKVITTNMNVRAEMSSLEQNRITLSDSQRDFLGQSIAHVTLKFNPREIHAAWEYLNTELLRTGLGRMGVPRRVKTVGGGHMMGSTRMGNDPRRSVTDAHGRVHGVRNLYVAGSSLFPSAAAANPTLTIVALSLRLADHLAGRLQ